MSFLYTAVQANNYQNSNALFADKGISDLAPSRASDILLIGRPHSYEIAYGSYIHALPAFLRATVLQSKVSAIDAGQRFKLPPSSYLPIPPPPLLLRPSIPLKNEGERMQLLQKLGEGIEITNFQDQAHVTIETPNYEALAPNLNLFDTDNRTTTNTTNLKGYRSYLETVKILTAFLATHHYAAFQAPESSRIAHVLYAGTPMEDDSAIVRDLLIDYTTELAARGLPPVTPSAERRELVGNVPEACDGTWNLQSAVVIAQPSPFAPLVNFGPAGGVPFLPGYMLPYFDGLLTPDQNFLPSIMRRFFLRSFGNDDESIDKGFRAWRLGHTTIFRTHSGKVLSHIFLCIQAALEAQARIFVVQSGRRYLGCAIVGYNFHLTINGITKAPETAASLRTLLTRLDPHTIAVGEITEILRGLELIDGLEDINEAQLISGKTIWKEINKRVHAEGEDMKSLRDAVDRLSFEEQYLTLSKNDILRWIRLLTAEESEVAEEIDNLPMYLTSDLMYNKSREHQVLASFGPMAPSFLNLSGGRFKIPLGASETDHASIPDEANKGNRPLEKLLVVGKKVSVAVSDWNKMRRSREVSQNQQQRSAGYKNVMFTQQARDEIWDALKAVPPFQKKVQKRRREEEEDSDDEGGESSNANKRARTKGKAVAKDLFDDL